MRSVVQRAAFQRVLLRSSLLLLSLMAVGWVGWSFWQADRFAMHTSVGLVLGFGLATAIWTLWGWNQMSSLRRSRPRATAPRALSRA